MPRPVERSLIRIAAFALLLAALPFNRQHATANDPVDKLEKMRAEVVQFVTTTDYERLVQILERWKQDFPLAERKPLIILLLKKLPESRVIGLTNCDAIAINSRVRAGKMRFNQGWHLMIAQDLFLENGRCAWAVQQLLTCKLPHFTEEVNKDQTQLDQHVREAYLTVIDAMAMPPPKPEPAPKPPRESNLRKMKREGAPQPFWRETP